MRRSCGAGLMRLTGGFLSLSTGLAVLACVAAAIAPSPAGAATFGKTTVGASKDVFSADRKRAVAYTLPSAGAVSQLSVYLEPTTVSGQQVMKGVVYADAGGAPGALKGVSNQLTFSSTQAAGWYALTFPSALELPAGKYWIGVLTGASALVAGYRYDSVANSRDYNQNTYSAGPSNPFGAPTIDSQQFSLYATYIAAGSPPVNTSPPTISGTPQQGRTLTASPGSWTGSPGSYAYQWQRCDAQGANCAPIALATTSSYAVVEADVGHALRVTVRASNEAGTSAPATSAPTAVVTTVSQTKPSTSGLTLTPRIKVLRATWSVTGVGEGQRLIGWQRKWRPVTEPELAWTTVTPDLPASAREDIVTQLDVRPHEISVLPRYEESGTKKSGVAQTAVATPLKDEPGLDLGKVRFRAETGLSGKVASWDKYDLVEWEPWIEKHVPYLKAYPTRPAASSTRWLDIGLPPSTIVQGYWDWDKEDLEGGPFAPLNAERRSSFITHRVEGTIPAGYSGIWLDDINWHTFYRNNKQSTAFEPEFKEQLELIRAIRAKIGAGKLLTINSQFFDVEEYVLGLTGTETERKVIREAYAEADFASKEFGISNLTSAATYKQLFEWVGYLHEHGTQLEMHPTNAEASVNPGLFRKEHQFNLATYLLFNAQATALKSGRQSLGGDFIGGKEMTPSPGGNTDPSIAGSPEPKARRFWRGYELDLGTPVAGEGGKYKRESSGLWVRSFSSGIVYALEPGAAAVKVPALPRMMETVGGTKLAPGSRPELKASEGLVLIG